MSSREGVNALASPRGGIWYITATCPRFPLERHDALEMNLVLGGSGVIVTGGRSFEVRRGSLVWLLPGEWHAITQASPDLALWVALFHPDVWRARYAGDLRFGERRADLRVDLAPSDLQRLSLRGFRLLGQRSRVTEFNADLAALLVDAWQTRMHRQKDHADPHPAVARASALLTHAEDRWSLTALSRRVGLSPFQLSRAFHAHMGVTLGHYGNHQRVQRFECLFGDGTATNTLKAALDAGFGSYSQFFRVYRAVTGWTPEMHRKRVTERIAPRERWDDPLSSAGGIRAVD